MKNLKRPLKKLNWNNGNLFENVENLRKQLKDVQCSIDKNPYDKDLRNTEATLLQEYSVAVEDEEKFLF